MDTQKIKAVLIAVLTTIVAVWLGLSAATDQLETSLWVAGVSTLVICAMLGRRIWMIIPFATALNLTLMVRGQPDTLLLAQILFIGFCLLQFLIRRLSFKIQFTELEFWMLLLCICVGQAYLRNPVGLNIFGGESVGARPYAIFGIVLVTSIILGSLRIPASDLRWILRLTIIGSICNFLLTGIGYFVPKIGIWYGAAAINSSISDMPGQSQYGVNEASRIGFLGQASNDLALLICTFKSPIRACFHPIWGPLVLLSFAFAALSGFRNEIATVGLTYLVGIAYRGGFHSVLIATLALIVGIIMLAILNMATPLPANIQRSLSFLPGTWNQMYVQDAEGSTEWRVEMWKEALLTDHWINNKWFGDGLGMTREELNYIESFGANQTAAQSMAKSNTLSLQQEFMMASNNYHSGPVSTIRTIGYFGLAILLIAQIRLAFHMHRLIMKTKGSQWLPLTLIVGIPLIFGPFFWVFIYGSFGGGASAYLSGAAMVRILQNNLPWKANSA